MQTKHGLHKNILLIFPSSKRAAVSSLSEAGKGLKIAEEETLLEKLTLQIAASDSFPA